MEVAVNKPIALPKTNSETLKLKIETRQTLLNLISTHLSNTYAMLDKLVAEKNSLFANDPSATLLNYNISNLEIEAIKIADDVKFKTQEMEVWMARLPDNEAYDRAIFEKESSESNINYDKYYALAVEASKSEDGIGSIFKEVLAEIETFSEQIKTDQKVKNVAYRSLRTNLLHCELIK